MIMVTWCTHAGLHGVQWEFGCVSWNTLIHGCKMTYCEAVWCFIHSCHTAEASILDTKWNHYGTKRLQCTSSCIMISFRPYEVSLCVFPVRVSCHPTCFLSWRVWVSRNWHCIPLVVQHYELAARQGGSHFCHRVLPRKNAPGQAGENKSSSFWAGETVKTPIGVRNVGMYIGCEPNTSGDVTWVWISRHLRTQIGCCEWTEDGGITNRE